MEALNTFLANVQREIIDPIIWLLAAAAFIVFAWGVVEFIRKGDNDEARKTGQQHMIWGVIGLAIIFGASGILTLLKSFVGAS